MGLRYGQSLARASAATSPVTTGSITLETNEKVIVLLLKARGGTDRAGGSPTFGGQTMTQANSTQKAATSPEASCELWYLLDPPTGANTASIPNTGSLTLFYTLSTGKASRTNSGLVVLDGSNGGNNTSTNPTPGAVVVTQDEALGFAITAGGWTNYSSATPDIGVAIATTDDGADGGGEQYHNLTTGPGAFTLSWTFGTSDDWGAVAAYFCETKPPEFQNYQAAKCISAGIISLSERIR